LNDLLTLPLLKVVAFFASIPYASLYVSTPTAFEILLFYLLLLSLVHLRKGKRMKYVFLGLCLIFFLDITFWNWKGLLQKNVTITFLDVGHGDSILIELPKGKTMLIDGGGLYEDQFDIGKNVVAPFLWKKKIHRIDTLVLTHPDPDHFKGLNFIASQFSIGQFWDGGLQSDSESYFRLKDILSEKKTERLTLTEKTPPQSIKGVELSFFNPPALDEIQKPKKISSFINNSSLVIKLRFKNVSFLFPGDIEKEAEERMLRKDYPLKVDVIKIPHHGSLSSSTPLFLEKVKPAYAILSVGERNLGRLPHPEVLRRYSELGSRIFRTDRHGAITMITDGEKIEIKTFLKGEP